MIEHLQQLLLGLGSGAAIAALALGVLIAYRASGVVNLAHAALGTFLAATYFSLRQRSELLLPIPDLSLTIGGEERSLPGTIQVLPDDYYFTWGTSLVITLVIAALYGLLIWVLVFRPLRRAPALAKVVGSLGLFLYLLAVTDQRIGTQGAAVGGREPILPQDVVQVGGVDLPADRLWLALIVVATTAVLWAASRWTRLGLATRAAAESEKGAVLVGLAPERIAAVSWMTSSVLAGAAMILIAPFAGLNPGTSALLIVPALAAALLGGFTSFWLTTAAGLGIGMLQSEILGLRTDWTWLPQLDLGQIIPFLIIIGVMALRGEPLPSRGAIVTGHLPKAGRPRHAVAWAVGLGALGTVGLLTLDSTWRQGIIVSATMALIALSIVVLTGYVGQISLMPMALAGVGGFAMVKLTDAGVPFPLAPLLAAGVALAVGVVAGAPAVRVRGMNLAITTLAAAVAIEELVLQWSWFTGGRGGTTVPPAELGPLDLDISAAGADFPRAGFGVLCILVLAVSAVAVANLRRSETGLRWLAVRSNERAAASAGIDVTRTKLSAIALSSFLAGLGGTLFAYGHPSLSVDSFGVFNSLALLAITYLGGIAGVAGALIAGFLAEGGVMAAATGDGASQTRFALQGALLIAMAALYPRGIAGAVTALRDRVVARLRPPTESVGAVDPAPADEAA